MNGNIFSEALLSTEFIQIKWYFAIKIQFLNKNEKESLQYGTFQSFVNSNIFLTMNAMQIIILKKNINGK